MRSTVPGDAGEISPATLRLRAPLFLSYEQRNAAKMWRQVGLEIWEIAEEMGVSETDVALALANIRTHRPQHPRRTLNVSVAAWAKFNAMRLPGEAMWQTVNRVLGL
jgi:hypothetical protein